MSNPGDVVRRQNRKVKGVEVKEPETTVVEDIRESCPRIRELTPPSLGDHQQLAFAKWKIRIAYAYLAFTSLICLGAVLINPTLDVRVVGLALWGATSAALAMILHREERGKG